MQITGRNLVLVYEALDLAMDEIHNQIATCPDVNLYEEDIEALEAQQEKHRILRDRVGKALEREGGK